MPAVFQALALLGNILYLLPFMAYVYVYLDTDINRDSAWGGQPVRFLATGRVVWALLILVYYLGIKLFLSRKSLYMPVHINR